ncbi:type II toxin-antitoxin system VapB family antitoxin [Xanthobacteraceae bacterium Astr-EGSB]|uniref:type II toxin-antitoxin system VapB family antitoxin n=1 Tax=Astrobacterium formosum TaxID=3069710 RepID=UPI0027B624A7|nr:type II toxin-antitoxin system VapB family antitoxin [Xanthobacteraceae bacterium Astr-EGSB]
MAVLIKDEEADRLIRELAERTGETITDAVKIAVRERLSHMPLHRDEISARKRMLTEIVAAFDAMPTVDARTPDEILGYNEHGVFD